MIILNNQPVNISQIEKHVNFRGTCDAGMTPSTTVIVCADLAGFGNDLFNNMYFLQIVKNANNPGNNPENNARKITDYVSATGTFTTPIFPANVEEGDEILILHQSQVVPTEWVSLSSPQISKYSGFANFQTKSGNPADFARNTMSLEALSTALDTIPVISLVTLSDVLLHSNDAEKNDNPGAYIKAKEILCMHDGTYRIKFDLRLNFGSTDGKAKIYKNGVAFGTERSSTGVDYVTFSEDLSFVRGDLIQLYYYTTNVSYDVYVRNFRLYGDVNINFVNLLE